MTIRDRIKELCVRAGTSLPKLEEALGFGNGTIVKWDKSSPSLVKLVQVADYFGMTVSELLDESVDPATNPLYNKIMERAEQKGFADVAELCHAARIRAHGFHDLRFDRAFALPEEQSAALAKVLDVDVDFFNPYNADEQKNKPTTEIGDELSEAKREAWSVIQEMDDETLERFLKAAKAMLGEL